MRIPGKHDGSPATHAIALLIAAAGLVGDTNIAFASTAQEGGDGAPAPQEAGPPPAVSLALKGALRFNYFLKSWEGQEDNRARLGDLVFETIQIGADASYGPLAMSMGYRFYQDYDVLHHAYVGYALSPSARIDVGVVQAPFGLLPFASHGWFLNLGYYMGLEDDYDLGVRGVLTLGALDLRLAFFKNSEGSFRGSSLASARYSYDVVPATSEELGGLGEDRANSEANQLNARVAYNLDHGHTGTTEIGVSGRVGGLYNATTAAYGHHWAAAAHADGRYGPLHLQLEGVAYRFRPRNPAGQSDAFVVMGAFDAPYLVASAGYLILANLAYTLPLARGPLTSLTFYNDYSVLLKTEGSYPATHHDALGLLVQAGPIYTFFDLAMGRHHPWLGPSYTTGLAAGNVGAGGALEDSPWHTRFNVNIGYYF